MLKDLDTFGWGVIMYGGTVEDHWSRFYESAQTSVS